MVLVVWAASAAPLVRAAIHGSAPGTAVLVLAALQAAVALGGMALSRYYASAAAPLPQRVRAALRPEAATALDRRLRRGELGALLAVRIALLLLLGLAAARPASSPYMWLVVLGLLAVFAAYLIRLARIARRLA